MPLPVNLDRLDVAPSQPTATLTLRTRPNWTAVWFFGFLAAMHASIAIPTLARGRWDGYLSAALGAFFLLATVAVYRCRRAIVVQVHDRSLRLRTGTRHVAVERFIGFQSVHGVRLTMADTASPTHARIELLCDGEDVECPPTAIPRQQALYLAMTMRVPLIKVLGHDPTDDTAHRLRGLMPN